ncbi:MAG TPA: ATP-binding cassette domain-containing protein [Acidimicrobiia bacterium]|nr:ATP-binding cassette domain-containing protein [Acidimicrobiia bacterium]
MLEVDGCSVSFGGVQALQDVSLLVSELEIVGIIGPNGAGKTTLFDVISGFRRPDAGRVRFRGIDVTDLPSHRRAAAGMARAFQNVGLIRGTTVRTNLLAAEHLTARYSATAGILGLPGTWSDERRLSERAGTLAEILGLTGLLDHEVDGLPYGLLKRVELAAVLATDPELLLLDEPTSGMGPAETDDFAAKLLELRRAFQLTVLMIEHHVPFVSAVCDHVYCLNFGQTLAAGKPEEVRTHPEVIRAYLGQAEQSWVLGAETARDPLVVVDNLQVRYGTGHRRSPAVLRDLSFEVFEGERLVLLGLNGAGKTTTLATLAGLLRPEHGSIIFDGRDITDLPAAERVSLGITLVPEGRQVFPGLTVDQNLRLGAWMHRHDEALIAESRERVLRVFPRLARRGWQAAGTLSGGEQQMLAIGRALMANPRLLLIDEASLGLSPAITQDVFGMIDEINAEGITVVLVEQGTAALGHADRAMILERGRIVDQKTSAETDHATLRERYLGTPA